MKGNSPDSNQPSFLLPSLKEQLDPNHPIYQLNERINWSVIEEDFKKLYSHTGRPAKPVRLMVSLLLLKQLEDLSDEQVIRRWVDIPYWQYLSGETHFQFIILSLLPEIIKKLPLNLGTQCGPNICYRSHVGT